MKLHEIFDTNVSLTDFTSHTKEHTLSLIAAQASQSEACKDIPEQIIREKLFLREQEGTTAFGHEIAIPHARIPDLPHPLFFILISKKGTDFRSIDHKKVKIFFVLLAPESAVDAHLIMLASLSRLIEGSGFNKEILNAKTPAVIQETISRYSNMDTEKKQGTQNKKLFVIILYMQEYLNPILEFFLEENVDGATIIESQGMGSYISNIPLFASFIGFLQEDKNKSKTIITVIPEDKEDILSKGIEKITGNFEKKQGAMLFSIPLTQVKGSMNML